MKFQNVNRTWKNIASNIDGLADDNFGSSFVSLSPDGKVVRLGDKIAYSNVTTVDWLGFFGQASYSAGALSA